MLDKKRRLGKYVKDNKEIDNNTHLALDATLYNNTFVSRGG